MTIVKLVIISSIFDYIATNRIEINGSGYLNLYFLVLYTWLWEFLDLNGIVVLGVLPRSDLCLEDVIS